MSSSTISIEITTLSKRNGVLSKRISLDPSGKLISDGSECVMGSGTAWRTAIADMGDLASHIAGLGPGEAIALGRLRDGLPDKVTVTTKAKLKGATAPDVIARTGEFIDYAPGAPGLLLIDVDTKGMPDTVRTRIKALGGVVAALASVVPELVACGCVVRNSTTTGLSRQDTGEALPGSEGRHIYILVRDGDDIERALRTLHDRQRLAGFGWFMVGAAGQLLDRSLADRTVYAPERLVFEAAPIVVAPLAQDRASRQPQAREGAPLDTATAILDLTMVEAERLRQLKAVERDRLKPESAKARSAWIDEQAKRLEDNGVMPAEAKHQAQRLADGGVLLPDVVLAFDDPELAGKTVLDVLNDPDKFVGATLADPLEGTEYGTGKARIMQRADGSLWVHSFAHGRTTYDLKLDADRLRERLANLPDDDVIVQFVRLGRRMAEVGGVTENRIRAELVKRLGIGVRVFAAMEKRARAAEDAEDRRRRREARLRERSEAGDTRPQFTLPPPDTPYLEIIAQLDAVFAASDAPEPPMRDVEGVIAVAMARPVDGMHLLTSAGANDAETKAEQLDPPEHVLLTKLTSSEVAEAIERHIDYINDDARSVRAGAAHARR